jgi:hypothetical protein
MKNFIIGLVTVTLIAWGAYALYQNNQEKNENILIMQEHPNYESYKETKDCSSLAPNNPYDEGTGHYAGFEWGLEGNYCDGNSDSFIEGCQGYETQQAAYSACLKNEK